MSIRLDWEENNIAEEGHRVYRSTSPLDPLNLPTPLASLGENVTSYIDDTVVTGTLYYYRVSAYRGAAERVSEEVSIQAASTTPDSFDPAAISASRVSLSDSNRTITSTSNSFFGAQSSFSVTVR